MNHPRESLFEDRPMTNDTEVRKEQRSTERLSLSIPIRVIGIARSIGDFSEDTRTTLVNQTGARIIMNHQVAPGDTLRIINLENHTEADFRVVGPTKTDAPWPAEVAVECIEADRNVWGIKFSPPLPQGGNGSGGLLVCRVCQQQVFWALTFTEIDVLDSTGQIPGECNRCGKSTYWTYGDTTRRPRQFNPSEPTEPPPPAEDAIKKEEKRVDKRLGMKVPVLVRTRSGQVEVSRTENLSKKGLAVNLSLELTVGETVTVICPYEESGPRIEQKAEVRRRPIYGFGGRRVYGLRIIR